MNLLRSDMSVVRYTDKRGYWRMAFGRSEMPQTPSVRRNPARRLFMALPLELREAPSALISSPCKRREILQGSGESSAIHLAPLCRKQPCGATRNAFEGPGLPMSTLNLPKPFIFQNIRRQPSGSRSLMRLTELI